MAWHRARQVPRKTQDLCPVRAIAAVDYGEGLSEMCQKQTLIP
jgi:hypothetical protein